MGKQLYKIIIKEVNDDLNVMFDFTRNKEDKMTLKEIKEQIKFIGLDIRDIDVNKYLRWNGCMRDTIKNESAFNGIKNRCGL